MKTPTGSSRSYKKNLSSIPNGASPAGGSETHPRFLWPVEASRHTVLYYSSGPTHDTETPSSGRNKSGRNQPTSFVYQIAFDARTGMLHIVRYPQSQYESITDDPDDETYPQHDVIAAEVYEKMRMKKMGGVIVDIIDPADIIGTDLEVKFLQDTFFSSPPSSASSRALLSARKMIEMSEKAETSHCDAICSSQEKPLAASPRVITYKQHIEQVRREKMLSSAQHRQVGVHNVKAAQTARALDDEYDFWKEKLNDEETEHDDFHDWSNTRTSASGNHNSNGYAQHKRHSKTRNNDSDDSNTDDDDDTDDSDHTHSDAEPITDCHVPFYSSVFACYTSPCHEKKRQTSKEKGSKQFLDQNYESSSSSDSSRNYRDRQYNTGAVMKKQQAQSSTVTVTVRKNNAVAFLNIYVYSRDGVKGDSGTMNAFRGILRRGPSSPNDKYNGKRNAIHRRYEIAPTMDFAYARSIVRAIRLLAQLEHYSTVQNRSTDAVRSHRVTTNEITSTSVEMQLKTPTYLVFLDAYSGNKKAPDIYDRIVGPMLDQCGVEHNLFVSQYPGHTSERMLAMPSFISSPTTSVDEDDAIPYNDDVGDPGDTTDVSKYDGIIVLGGDGTLFEILQGLRSRKKDRNDLLKRLKFGIVGCGRSNGLAASLLSACKENYGPVESAFMICKGHTNKIDLSLVHTIRKTYLSFRSLSWGLISDIELESCNGLGDIDSGRLLYIRSYRARLSYLGVEYKKSIKSVLQSFPDLEQDLPPSWTTVESDFILIWISQLSHSAYNVMQSPESTPRDGLLRIMMIRKGCSRGTLMNILSSLNKGQHTSYKEVEFIDCVAYRLVPQTQESSNVLDGQVVESGPIQGCILPSAMNVFYQDTTL